MSRQKEIIQNIMAGITVSFIALSLGAAFGILSGRGAFSGMISSVIIAFVASLFGGTRIQCSGPTGPMTAVVAVMVAFAHDEFTKTFPNIPADHFVNVGILLGGALMILFGFLRLGKYITLIPNVVISGFMNGIAIIIWLDQIKRLFGLGGKTAIAGNLLENLFLVLGSFFCVFFSRWLVQKTFPKIAGLLSGTFLTIIIMSFLGFFLFPTAERVELGGALKSFSDVSLLLVSQFPTEWSFSLLLLALPFAFQLALLGYLDTLMTSLIIDKMTHEKTKANKELFAQGTANSIVAFFGGIPGAQATIRSVLMINEKATMRLAGVLVGVFALLEIILLQDLINMIPQAVFSGILLKVGFDVFDWLPVQLYFKEIRKWRSRLFRNFFGRHDERKIFVTNREILMIAGTTLVTVFFDLNTAVIAFTAFFYLHNKVFCKKNPMRDLKPEKETAVFADER